MKTFFSCPVCGEHEVTFSATDKGTLKISCANPKCDHINVYDNIPYNENVSPQAIFYRIIHDEIELIVDIIRDDYYDLLKCSDNTVLVKIAKFDILYDDIKEMILEKYVDSFVDISDDLLEEMIKTIKKEITNISEHAFICD